MLEPDLTTLMDENGSGYPYAAVHPILADADIAIGKVEGRSPSAGRGRRSSHVIVYGLGVIVFDLDTDDLATLGPRPFQTAVMRFELSPSGEVLSVTARPVFIDPLENRPVPPTGDRLDEVEARIRMLNAGLQ